MGGVYLYCTDGFVVLQYGPALKLARGGVAPDN